MKKMKNSSANNHRVAPSAIMNELYNTIYKMIMFCKKNMRIESSYYPLSTRKKTTTLIMKLES